MIPRTHAPRRAQPAIAAAVLLLASFRPADASGPGSVSPAGSEEPVLYVLDLRHPDSHLVGVTITLPNALPGTEIQFPAWNALYQIRDFIHDVQNLRAQCDGHPVGLVEVDLNTRRLESEPCAGLEVNYEVYANGSPPYGSVLDEEHAFFNLALLLFYLPSERNRAVRIRFLLPAGWKLAALLDDAPDGGEFAATNYDALVDGPVEAGHFAEYSYRQGEATYRVIVHADPADYSPKRLLEALERITLTETNLMQDVPFRRYTFLFHFLPGSGGGGMEHANGTAIALPAENVRRDISGVEGVAAHEFFHLWNVKRIRPQGLEPVDYVHGNDTSDLWFSEGVTSTYGELSLVRSGLISRKAFYRNLADGIRSLEERPARHFQSAEESGREAWLEKYPDYTRPDRSISYYNKGELLGYLLDLAIRHSTANTRSLDDLMRALNHDFAQGHRFFTDGDLTTQIARLAPAFTGLHDFFLNAVEGTANLDYNQYLAYAGLQVETRSVERAALGFVALSSFTGPVTVDAVTLGSEAERAGLRPGDILVKVNGQPAEPSEEMESYLRGGENVKLRVRRGKRTMEFKFSVGRVKDSGYQVTELSNPSPDQVEVREGWLNGSDSGTSR